MITKNITISGNIISIPERLSQVVDFVHDESMVLLTAPNEALFFLHSLNIVNTNEIKFGELLKIVEDNFEKGDFQNGALVLGSMASGYVLIERENSKPQEGIGILVDALLFEQNLIPLCKPEISNALADQSARLIEQILKLFSMVGSLGTIISLQKDIETALQMIEIAWAPEFRKTVFALRDLTSLLASVFREDKYAQLNLLRKALMAVSEIKNSLHTIDMTGSKRQKKLLEVVLNSLGEIIQQEFMLVANVQYVSEGLDQEHITRQVRKLIGQVEQRLRALIVLKYEQRYGKEWISQIEAVYPKMYSHWVLNHKREQSAFKNYNDHAPDILEFAGFDDLSELISSQWKLFQSCLDFGFESRNQAIFYDKMKQITKVRNPLAHNRIVPENEILRARVLCTDILLALDSGGVSSM